MGRDLYLIEKAQNKAFPLNTLIELTYKCNLRCVHCYISRNNGQKEMTTAELFDVLRQLKECGCLYLSLSGGEIFTRPDFFKIARYARKLGFGLRLFTNGTFIDEDNADKIKELYPLTVEISIYGFRKTHDSITKVTGSFDRTTKAIRLLAERKVKVFTKTMLMRQNVHEFWRLDKYISQLGAKSFGVGGGLMITVCDDGNCRPLRYRLTDAQLKRYLREEVNYFMQHKVRYFPKKLISSEIICLAGIASCNIDPYGHVSPCNQISIDKDNNLRNIPLKKIWAENPQLIQIRSLREADKKDCYQCDLRPYCHLCPGMALLETGSLLSKLPEACRIARIRKGFYESAKSK
jgi:radical SAM protein with 4Fe4S-binding SPASM domain